jgi:putative Holliday junction resolvase
VLWDERLTTVAAERELRGSGLRGEKKKALIDQAAATVLLQSYLDAQRARDGY